MEEFKYVFNKESDIDMSKIGGCPHTHSLDECEKSCKKYHSCYAVALANDILVEYEETVLYKN